jgi:hypothetical protein
MCVCLCLCVCFGVCFCWIPTLRWWLRFFWCAKFNPPPLPFSIHPFSYEWICRCLNVDIKSRFSCTRTYTHILVQVNKQANEQTNKQTNKNQTNKQINSGEISRSDWHFLHVATQARKQTHTQTRNRDDHTDRHTNTVTDDPSDWNMSLVICPSEVTSHTPLHYHKRCTTHFTSSRSAPLCDIQQYNLSTKQCNSSPSLSFSFPFF